MYLHYTDRYSQKIIYIYLILPLCFDKVFISATRSDTMNQFFCTKSHICTVCITLLQKKAYNLVSPPSFLGSWYQDTCAHHTTVLLHISHWKPTVLQVLYLLPHNTTPIQIHMPIKYGTLNIPRKTWLTQIQMNNTGTKISEYNGIMGKTTTDVRSLEHSRMLDTFSLM